MISKRMGFSLRLVILLKENYWCGASQLDPAVRPGGCPAVKSELRGLGAARSKGYNELLAANIPYAKEIFRSANYSRVSSAARSL
ncbi:hypothetical protein ACOKM5_15385 [Streptomyces sp. BH097]|uniref:hypothetical protein n=1 Tax=unclassified Streptomyces TaxID=2593676 RepID=UPI003BB7D94C